MNRKAQHDSRLLIQPWLVPRTFRRTRTNQRTLSLLRTRAQPTIYIIILVFAFLFVFVFFGFSQTFHNLF
ncbi:MAG: hypothetical protein MRERV_46c018 [Mycoplasmataceae bacterium RV_VA103A]|nr:MAG: hypothetical protein MRERV_46c018 [Mycoplasmataceae bacterium RV_VA103A]